MKSSARKGNEMARKNGSKNGPPIENFEISMGSFNDTHPELRPGEKWRSNVWLDGCGHSANMTWYKNLTLPGKRLGKIAYAMNGVILPEARPLFIERGF